MALPTDDEVIELEHADLDIEPDSEGDELEEPTTEEMQALSDEPDTLEQVAFDGFERARTIIPQPERARSSPDLPKVRASSFKRFIA
ncbi:MAG: hypothetical protein U0228_22205 [Myxococcaceae bacterium]